MHLGAINVVKGLLGFGSKSKVNNIDNPKTDNNIYIRGNIADRGPCPALNALSNQGYLPRDGKNITLPEVEAALKSTLHFNGPLASSLTRSLKPLVRKDGTFDLFDMRKHDVLEHDRSVTRFDFRQGDNNTFQPALFEALLADADGGPVTIKTLAKTYNRRKKESKAAGSPNLPLSLWFVNLLQTVSLLNTAQTGDALQKDLLVEFYTEERIPDVILQNQTTRTLFGLVSKALSLLFHTIF
ncbi:Chloroperoxidase [Leptodontidium sp. 2 PMI_412]|nr:Chloroperoxidase [Leptodontidium sp. MPI-SDFR-AT-0119]KAH9219925.1 Chloroperoxidase [Leptodontidium sp. 2 PMI_412]